MSSIPELHEIIRRFSIACVAFDEAIAASQRRDVAWHEAGLLQSAREMGSALELGAIRCIGLARPEKLTAALANDFDGLLQMVSSIGKPPIDEEEINRLKSWRALRNRAEHPPITVPSVGRLLSALRGTRRFLLAAFGDLPELPDPDQQPTSSPSSEHAPSAPAVDLFDDEHRGDPPKNWIADELQEGLRRLHAGRAAAPLQIDDVRELLTSIAVQMAEHGSAPSEPISADLLKPALVAKRRLYVEAAWFTEDAGQLRFRDPRLPALLAGVFLSSRDSRRSNLRLTVGANRRWGEAAWAATASGGPAADWLLPLVDSDDSFDLIDRVVTACAALAGTRIGRRDAGAGFVEKAADIAAAALVWLVPPVHPERRHLQAPEPWDGWRLDRADWQRAVLNLALGTESLRTSADAVNWRQPGGRLGRLLSALGLAPRLHDEAARAVVVLGRPWAREGVSPLDESFFTSFHTYKNGIAERVDRSFKETWMVQIGVRALYQGDARRANRWLVVPGENRSAGFLLSTDSLLPVWCQAWERLASTHPAEDAAHAWVQGATWVAKRTLTGQVIAFLIEQAPARLKALAAWDSARELLRVELTPDVPPTRPDDDQLRYASALFSFARFSPSEWRERIERWTDGVHLPWRVLLQAGAPHDAIAEWSVKKLRKKQQEAPDVDGPIGIIASPGAEILSTDSWQLAFNQAREALDWLLLHGDEAAVRVLADACFAANEAERVNPICGTFAGLSVPLSQVIWGCAVGRPGGRSALYARVERGDHVGDVHFLPHHTMHAPTENLWQTLLGVLLVPFQQDTSWSASEEQAAEARRLLAAFERWTADQPPGYYRREPTLPFWEDRAMRATKAMAIACGALHGLDLVEPMELLLRGIAADPAECDSRLFVFAGSALFRLSKRASLPVTLLELASSMAARFALDDTHTYWRVLIHHLGPQRVWQLLDSLDLPHAGLGVFDAMLALAPDDLARCQDRPDLFRAVLVRSADGRFHTSPDFHARAWARPWKPEEIPQLDLLEGGDWLPGLIEHSRRWPDGDRGSLLRWLAQRSRSAAVRRSCLAALL